MAVQTWFQRNLTACLPDSVMQADCSSGECPPQNSIENVVGAQSLPVFVHHDGESVFFKSQLRYVTLAQSDLSRDPFAIISRAIDHKQMIRFC